MMEDGYPKSPSDRPILMQSYNYQPPLQAFQAQYQLNVPGQLSLSHLVDGSQGYEGGGQAAFETGGGPENHLTEDERVQAEIEKKKVQSRERVRRFRDRKRKEKEDIRAQRALKAAQQGELNVRIRRELVKEVVDKFVEVVEGRPPAVAREILQKFLAHPQVKATLRDGAVPPLFQNPYPAPAAKGARSPEGPVSTPPPKSRKRKQQAPPQVPQQQGGAYSHQPGAHLQQGVQFHQQPQQQGAHSHPPDAAYSPPPGGSLMLAAGLVGAAPQSGSVHL